MLTLYTVLGCVTDINGAVPYMCQPASDKWQAVENWYVAACENIDADPEAFPAVSAEHQDIIDVAYGLRRHGNAFLDNEVLTLHAFDLSA